MEQASYDSLTRMERECLRLASPFMKSEGIAAELGISPHTVNQHLMSARKKLGGKPRYVAAEELRTFEKHPQSVTSQPLGMSFSAPKHEDGGVGATPDTVQEERAIFSPEPAEWAGRLDADRGGTSPYSAMMRVAIIAGTIFAILAAIVLAKPASQSVQDLANIIKPPTP